MVLGYTNQSWVILDFWDVIEAMMKGESCLLHGTVSLYTSDHLSCHLFCVVILDSFSQVLFDESEL